MSSKIELIGKADLMREMGFAEGLVQDAIEKTASFESALELLLNPQMEDYKMVMIVRNDLQMSAGKVAAQCCHGCLDAYQASMLADNTRTWVTLWESGGSKKITLQCDGLDSLHSLHAKASSLGLVAKIVCDAGHTQIAAGSQTVLCIGPAPSQMINQVSGSLSLY